MGAPRQRLRTIARLIACAALVTSCASDAAAPVAAPSPTPTATTQAQGPDEPDDGDRPTGSAEELAAAGTTSADDDAPAAAESSSTSAAGGTEPEPEAPEPDAEESSGSASAREPFDPYRSDVPVTAELTPTCALPGGNFRIEVHTEPERLVAYHAIYDGEEGGAHEPFGEGHGGNNAGYADAEGNYTDSWVVSPDAPVGEGRVEVFAADGDKIGYVPVEFEIADPLTGGCP